MDWSRHGSFTKRGAWLGFRFFTLGEWALRERREISDFAGIKDQPGLKEPPMPSYMTDKVAR
jgi:hypothetical protein